MHNKVMLFDDAVLITGGRNIENSYFDHSTEMDYRDRDVLVVGKAVRDAVTSFEQFWDYRYSVASRELSDVDAQISSGSFRRFDARSVYFPPTALPPPIICWPIPRTIDCGIAMSKS